MWDNPSVLLQRRPDGAVVLDPTLTEAGQAVVADDEEAVLALHSAGEDVVTFRVVGTGVLHILLDDVGAAGAGGAEGVGDDEVGHRSCQPSRRKQRTLIVPAAQRREVVFRQTILVDGPAAEPAPEAADHPGYVVFLDHQDGAGRAAAPAHFAELVGGLVRQERQ